MYGLLPLLALIPATSAHFAMTYPAWRGDSFKTQYTNPCGGVEMTDETHNNRTKWPLDGGAVVFEPSHTWAQTFINIGLGNEGIRFTHELVAPFNQTGNGTLCFPKLEIPEALKANISEGTNATIQVIQLGSRGASLYNCADITFSSEAEGPAEGVCTNSTGVGAGNFVFGGVELTPASDNDSGNDNDGNGNDNDNNNDNKDGESSAAGLKASMIAVVAGVVAAGMML